jgi:threonyl-tRNA synthetase
LLQAGIRSELDLRNEKLGHKVREAQVQKIPYMLVIGDKEAEQGTVSPRARSGQNLGAMDLGDFIRKVQTEAVPGYKE